MNRIQVWKWSKTDSLETCQSISVYRGVRLPPSAVHLPLSDVCKALSLTYTHAHTHPL